MEPGVPLVHLS